MHRTATLVIATALTALAQQPPANPNMKFEVATLKPSAPGPPQGPCGIRPQPGGEVYSAECATLTNFLIVAYRLKPDQISGGPGWIQTDRFDMRAKAEKPSSTDDLHAMLKNLLAERFKLRFHYEKKELPIYALTVDKSGAKLTPHQATSAGDPWIDESQPQFLHMKMAGTFCPMELLAFRLGLVLDRPVADMTNLKGDYDFTLQYTRDLPPNIHEGASINGSPIDTSGPNVFEAVRQQLGLRLDRQKGPVDILVIDRAEKPTDSN